VLYVTGGVGGYDPFACEYGGGDRFGGFGEIRGLFGCQVLEPVLGLVQYGVGWWLGGRCGIQRGGVVINNSLDVIGMCLGLQISLDVVHLQRIARSLGESIGECTGALEFALFVGVEEQTVSGGCDGYSTAYGFDSIFVVVEVVVLGCGV